MYFDKCMTLDELKREYRRLVMIYHPDRGGDLRIMQAINAEHDKRFEYLKYDNNRRAAAHEEGFKYTRETPEQFRDIVNALLHIPNIKVELCGSWLWIESGIENRYELKKLGCRWSATKHMWYWFPSIDKQARIRVDAKFRDMDDIRDAYGSHVLGSTEGANDKIRR